MSEPRKYERGLDADVIRNLWAEVESLRAAAQNVLGSIDAGDNYNVTLRHIANLREAVAGSETPTEEQP